MISPSIPSEEQPRLQFLPVLLPLPGLQPPIVLLEAPLRLVADTPIDSMLVGKFFVPLGFQTRHSKLQTLEAKASMAAGKVATADLAVSLLRSLERISVGLRDALVSQG